MHADITKRPKGPTRVQKALVIPVDVLLSKGYRGGKYYRRVPTGNVKRPYRYYYTRQSYERAHGKEGVHVGGERAKRTHAIKKLKAELKKRTHVKNALNDSVSVTKAERFWVKGTDFGLPAQTIHVHAKDTGRKNQFGEPIREYHGERKELHDEIIAAAVKGVKRVPDNQKPVAIVMMGGGGAGKGTLIKAVVHDHGDFVHVDPDEVKKEFPEYKQAMSFTTIGGTTVTAKDAAWMAHEESGDVGERMLATAMGNRQNVIVDGTGKNGVKHADKIKALQAQGYHVKLLYAHTEMEEAVSRAAGRADRSGRYVPIPVLEDAHTKIPGNFEYVARHADEFMLFRSEFPAPTLLWSGSKGQQDTIHDANEVSTFKALGTRLHKERGITIPSVPEHLMPKAAPTERMAASLAFWTDLRKAQEKPPSLSMKEMLARIAANAKHYHPDTTEENYSEGGEELMREDASKGEALHKSQKPAYFVGAKPMSLEW